MLPQELTRVDTISNQIQESSTKLYFETVEGLEKSLVQHQIDPSKWNGYTVKDLFKDIQEGECSIVLENDQLLRKIEVVSVHCFYTNENNEKLKLIEEFQKQPDGSIRNRGYDFVSETMKPEETPHEAAIRGLEEELQISDPQMAILRFPEKDENKRKVSSTYLGLNGHYIVHHFKTEIPPHLFREKYIEIEKGTETHFSWIKI